MKSLKLKKKMTPFDHIKNLHTKQRRWKDFNDEEKKQFNVFKINKTLSFNPKYLDIVNMVQNYTGLNQILSQKEIFNLYLSYWTSIAKKKGFEINNELRARIWNGGAYGYLKEGAAKENLDIYWEKVSQELE